MAKKTPKLPVCAHCGNDGRQASLYLTVDALWRPEHSAWELIERDDDGGREFDCLGCDGRTSDDTGSFPYGFYAKSLHMVGQLIPPTDGAAALVAQIARMTLTDETEGSAFGNDEAMDGLIRRARALQAEG